MSFGVYRQSIHIKNFKKLYYNFKYYTYLCIMSNDEYQQQRVWAKPQHEEVYKIIKAKLEEEFKIAWLNQDPDRSYLPKDYGKDNL